MDGLDRAWKSHRARRLGGRRQIGFEARPRVVLAQTEEVTTLEWREQGRRLAFLDEHRQRKIRPLAGDGPLRRLPFPTGIVLGQIIFADDAKDVVGVAVALLHPCRDVAAGRNLPFVDMWRMAERLQLLADPKRPVPVAAGIADEDIRHPRPPAVGDGASSVREKRCASNSKARVSTIKTALIKSIVHA